MQRLLLITGFLLLPTSVHAEALSPWVAAVLVRTQAGIDLANGLSHTSCDEQTVQSEISNNQSLIRELVIPSLQREAEAESLREGTVCFQSDKHLLELKLREIQDAMSTAIEHCKVSTTKALRENYRFLFGAYASFLKGGTNPAYKDDLLRYRYPFHDIDLWNAGARDPVALTGSTAPLCPYTTDFGVRSIGYLPTSVGGPSLDVRSFGCDQTVLETIPAPYDDEARTLKNFMDLTNNLSVTLFDIVSQTLFHLDDVIGMLNKTIPPSAAPGSKPPPPHAEQTGCLKPIQPDFTSDSPAYIDALLSTYPDYFESYNLRDDGSGNFTFNPLPDETLPTGMLNLPIIDYFLSTPNAGILTRSYIDLRAITGAGRPLPNYLVSQMFDSFFMSLLGASTMTRMQIISANIEREMGILESGNADALQRMQDSSVPLEAAIQSLISVVDEELPKKYIPQLAFFLARSCVDGHCQQTLEAVVKRTFNPYCHPYTSGKYLEADAVKRCYCDPEIEFTDETFWKQYCSADFSEDMSRYDAMPQELIPACIEETISGSGSARLRKATDRAVSFL